MTLGMGRAEAALPHGPDPAGTAGVQELPVINWVRLEAEEGRPEAQTRLADIYLAAGDFTNAVAWYRKAVDQGHVPAQITLAACTMTGRGTEKSPSEAADLLRRAADIIEGVQVTATPALARTVTSTSNRPTTPQPRLQREQSAPPPPGSIIITRETVGAPDPGEVQRHPAASALVVAAIPNRLRRGQRSTEFLAAKPFLQELKPVLGPHPDLW